MKIDKELVFVFLFSVIFILCMYWIARKEMENCIKLYPNEDKISAKKYCRSTNSSYIKVENEAEDEIDASLLWQYSPSFDN